MRDTDANARIVDETILIFCFVSRLHCIKYSKQTFRKLLSSCFWRFRMVFLVRMCHVHRKNILAHFLYVYMYMCVWCNWRWSKFRTRTRTSSSLGTDSHLPFMRSSPSYFYHPLTSPRVNYFLYYTRAVDPPTHCTLSFRVWITLGQACAVLAFLCSPFFITLLIFFSFFLDGFLFHTHTFSSFFCSSSFSLFRSSTYFS